MNNDKIARAKNTRNGVVYLSTSHRLSSASSRHSWMWLQAVAMVQILGQTFDLHLKVAKGSTTCFLKYSDFTLHISYSSSSTQRKQLKAVSSLLFHYTASFRSGRLVLGAESKRRNKIQKLMNKCNNLDLVKRKIHKSLILIDHEFVLS